MVIIMAKANRNTRRRKRGEEGYLESALAGFRNSCGESGEGRMKICKTEKEKLKKHFQK